MPVALKSAFLFALLAMLALPAAAQSASTDTGQISVAQVHDLLGRARSEHGARLAVTAYFAALGETTDVLLRLSEARGGPPLRCSGPLSLSQELAVQALRAAAPERKTWSNTAATPIIVTDMFERAGCR